MSHQAPTSSLAEQQGSRGCTHLCPAVVLPCGGAPLWWCSPPLFNSTIKPDVKKVHSFFTPISAAVSGPSWKGLSHVHVAHSAVGPPGSWQGPRGWTMLLHRTLHIIPELCPAVHASSSGMCDSERWTHGLSEGFLNTLLSSI